MNKIVQNIKKVGLFLFGVILIIWGYKVNATNNENKAKEEKAEKEVEESKSEIDKEEIKPDTIETEKTLPISTTPSVHEKKQPIAPKPIQKVETKIPEQKKTETPKVEEKKETVIETATPEESSGTE